MPTADLSLHLSSSFADVRADWQRLAGATGSVFSTWEWAQVWWRHFGGAGQLQFSTWATRRARRWSCSRCTAAASARCRSVRIVGGGVADRLQPVCAPEHLGLAARLDAPDARRAPGRLEPVPGRAAAGRRGVDGGPRVPARQPGGEPGARPRGPLVGGRPAGAQLELPSAGAPAGAAAARRSRRAVAAVGDPGRRSRRTWRC